MSLLDLPLDLLYCIVYQLDVEKDINAFLQASLRLYRCFNKHLYCFNIERSRSSALLWAAEQGRIGTVQKMIDYGADIHTEERYYGNALQIAAYRGHLSVVELLIDSGLDVNTQSGIYGSALHTASAGGHAKMASLLLSKGVDVNAQGGFYATALEVASAGGHQDLVELLLRNGAVMETHRAPAARWLSETDMSRS